MNANNNPNNSDEAETDFSLNFPNLEERRQEFEKIKQQFADAGLNLTLQQEAQMWEAGEELAAEIQEVLRENPCQKLIITFLGLAVLFFVPEAWRGNIFKITPIAQPSLTYLQAIENILTPEQHQFWQKTFSNRAQNTQ